MRMRETAMAAALLLGIASSVACPALASAQTSATRQIAVNVGSQAKPRDRMAQLSIGSDHPGTLIRNDSLAQLRIAQKELRFRYIRPHRAGGT